MATLKRRVDALEADRNTMHKSAAEMTDAELCRIAGVPLDVTDEELERIARGEPAESHTEA
ncbi:MAG: hypothetical protein AB3X44_15330 [Leptothrix sp. (in: b-proteobacteria)]